MSTLYLSLSGNRSLRKSIALVLVFNGAFCFWLLIKPGTPAQFLAVDNIGQTIGLLLGSLLCFQGLGNLWRHHSFHAEKAPATSQVQRWVPILLGLGVFSECIGQVIFTYYEQILRQSAPFPSWADACYLSAYPFLLLGILLLPTRPLSRSARTRILADGLMIMTAIVTFSWFFILGPTLQQGEGTLLAKFVGAAYPFSDLLLAWCLLLLAFRSSDPMMRAVVFLLALALTVIVITDSIFDYQTLQSAYATGSLLDAGWPCGYMLAGLAVRVFCMNKRKSAAAVQEESDPAASATPSSDTPSFWRLLIPYMLIPAVGLLVCYALFFQKQDATLATGIYLGGATLIGLVLIRQVLVLRETVQTRRVIQENNCALEQANGRLESLATTDMLTGLPNHRALSMLLEQEGERARRFGHRLSLLFFDGDRFKQVNDTYGHAMGDIVLRELGERARSVLRAGDTVGRFGGEEFLVLLPETDAQEARLVAERLRSVVAASSLAGGAVEGGIVLTVSIGMASYPDDGATASEAREQADQAMYWAKRLGRNQIRTAVEAARANRDAELKSATAHALERQELAVLDGRDRESVARAEQLGLIYSLMGALDMREPGMSEHAHEVSDLVTGMARILEFDEERIRHAATAAFLHDIGKIALPDRLLHQPRKNFSVQEWRLLHQHAELGAGIVEASPWLAALAPAICHHHERWDGTGDPAGLAGAAIPLEARLIGLAEAYHDMISVRPYQAARSTADALDELERCAGTQFDPALLPILREVLASRQEGGVLLAESEAHELFTHL